MDICQKLRDFKVSAEQEIIADSAEPKSIQEIYAEGFNIHGAIKGPDSIKQGIDILKRYKINVTANSHNLKKELYSYIWKKDKTGKMLNEPIDAFNHLIDPLRYVALNKLASKFVQEYSFEW
jgi:phage terminase large subunit